MAISDVTHRDLYFFVVVAACSPLSHPQDNVIPTGLKIDPEGSCFRAGSDFDQLVDEDGDPASQC